MLQIIHAYNWKRPVDKNLDDQRRWGISSCFWWWGFSWNSTRISEQNQWNSRSFSFLCFHSSSAGPLINHPQWLAQHIRFQSKHSAALPRNPRWIQRTHNRAWCRGFRWLWHFRASLIVRSLHWRAFWRFQSAMRNVSTRERDTQRGD